MNEDIQQPSNLPPLQQIPEFLQGDNWFEADIGADFLNFDEAYRAPRYTMERNGVPFADVGELHIVSGKPGNGKTGLMAQLEAAILGGQFGNTISRQIAHKVKDGDTVREQTVPSMILHIDTEQGKDDTIAFKNRVISMANISNEQAKQHFTILRLRDTETAKERWQKILKAIWTVKPTDIFLDGMLDIVEDYNDQKECQPIIRKCMMTSTYYDASLWAVLHENPMVDKLVGTLGSITQRKVSEIFTVIKVKQADLKEGDRRMDLPDIYFKVKQVKARGKDVEDWFFRYENHVGGWGQPVELNIETGLSLITQREMEWLKECNERFKTYNWTQSGATYTDLERHLRSKGMTSNRKISDMFNTAMEKGIIYKSDKKKYHYNGLKDMPMDGTQDLPFSRPAEDEKVPF